MPSSLVENLKKEIEGFKKEIKAEKIGHILEVGDGIAKISGLGGVGSQEMLEFNTEDGSVSGIAFNLEEDTVGAIILGDYLKVKEGDKVYQGQVLATLNQASALANLTSAQGTLAQAKANYDKILTGAKTEDIKISEDSLLSAEQDLTNQYLGGKTILSNAYAKIYSCGKEEVK